MTRSCADCGTKFQAKRPSARFCSAACQKRSKRREQSAGGVSARTSPVAVVALPGPQPPETGELVVQVEKQLRDANRLESWQGQAALDLARRIEGNPGAPLSQVASAHRELRSAVAEAVKGSTAAKSAVQKHRDQLAERRAARAQRGA